MCDLDDCPLCKLDDDLWDLTAPVPDHDLDQQLFEQSQLGHQFGHQSESET